MFVLILLVLVLSSFNPGSAQQQEVKPTYMSYAKDQKSARAELSYMIKYHKRPPHPEGQKPLYKRTTENSDTCEANIPRTFWLKVDDDYYAQLICKPL